MQLQLSYPRYSAGSGFDLEMYENSKGSGDACSIYIVIAKGNMQISPAAKEN